MSFDALPGEIVLHIGSFLPRSSFNSLLRVQRGTAALLTPELYRGVFPVGGTQPRNHQSFYYRECHLLSCVKRWKSDVILESLNQLPKTALERRFSGLDTIIHHTAGEGNTRLFDMLIGKGIDFDKPNFLKQTPLFVAVRRRDLILIKRLLELGATVVQVAHSNKCGFSVLGYAIKAGHYSVVQCLLDGLEGRGERITSSDRSIVTGVHEAISKHKLPTVRLLLDHGVDPSWRGMDGRSLLDMAMPFNAERIIKIFLDRFSKNEFSFQWEVFLFQSQLSHLKDTTVWQIAEGILTAGGNFENQRDHSGGTTLHRFATSAFIPGAKALIGLGADVLATQSDGATPLMALLLQSNRRIWADEDGETISRMLIEAMAAKARLCPAIAHAMSSHLYATNPHLARVTALHIAAEGRKYSVVSMLLDNGASVFALDGFGRTPLGRILSNGIRMLPPKRTAFAESYESLCIRLAKAMRREGFNFHTEVPDHIGEEAKSFLELAKACSMKLLHDYLSSTRN